MLAFCLMAFMAPLTGKAQSLQSVKPTADTLVNTDAATVTGETIPDGWNVAAVQVTARKVSGTLAGKVYVQHSYNGIDYVTFDSLTLSDASRTTKIFAITGTPALQYRALFNSSGTVRYLPELYILRRRIQ